MGTAAGRWVIAASVLGSGVAFIDGSVVNAALPAISTDLGANLSDLQWVVTGYLLSLSAFLVIGGSLGDRHGRRKMFLLGLVGFGLTSMLCGIAPTVTILIVARVLQGAAAALLLPNSLALISASFAPSDRGAAIGSWSGLGGIAGAIGPFLGGWLIGAVSWRAVFFINVPLCLVAVVLTRRHVSESRAPADAAHLDYVGGGLLAAGLTGVVYALIEGPPSGWSTGPVAMIVLGLMALVAFVVVEARIAHPMVPLDVFRNRQFSGVNALTLFVYASIGGAMFFVVLHLQTDLGYSALEAGASFIPVTLLMLAFSARSGAIAQRIGPRFPLTIGPFVVAVSALLLGRVEPGSTYLTGVLPGTLVLGVGLVITVAPLTTSVLAAIDDERAGVGSAINNAVARLGSLLAVAVLPGAAGLTDSTGALHLAAGYGKAMALTAGLAAVGGVIGFLTVRTATSITVVTHGNVQASCLDPCVKEEVDGRAAEAA